MRRGGATRLSGEIMDELRATPYSSPMMGNVNDLIGGLLGYLRDPRRTQQMQGLAGLLESTGIPQTVERLAYGQPITNINKANVPLLMPDTANAALTLLPMPPATNRAAMAIGRAGEQYAERIVPQVMERGGLGAQLLQDLTTGSRSAMVESPKPNVGGLLQTQAPKVESLSYRGSHTAPGPDFGAPLYDLTGGGQMYPADVYSTKATQFYGTGYPKADKEAFDLAKRVRGNPDAEVTMYRAVPKDEKITSINVGDWVTLSKDYAKTHGESVLGNDYKILTKKVKAKDLWTNADSIHEFGYYPE